MLKLQFANNTVADQFAGSVLLDSEPFAIKNGAAYVRTNRTVGDIAKDGHDNYGWDYATIEFGLPV